MPSSAAFFSSSTKLRIIFNSFMEISFLALVSTGHSQCEKL